MQAVKERQDRQCRHQQLRQAHRKAVAQRQLQEAADSRTQLLTKRAAATQAVLAVQRQALAAAHTALKVRIELLPDCRSTCHLAAGWHLASSSIFTVCSALFTTSLSFKRIFWFDLIPYFMWHRGHAFIWCDMWVFHWLDAHLIVDCYCKAFMCCTYSELLGYTLNFIWT